MRYKKESAVWERRCGVGKTGRGRFFWGVASIKPRWFELQRMQRHLLCENLHEVECEGGIPAYSSN